MTANERPPWDPIEDQAPDPIRFDDPFWTDERRAIFWDGLRRVGVVVLLGLLAFVWGAVVLLWLLNRALIGQPGPSGVAWLAMLLPGIGLFVLSVIRLVERRAPPFLRIIGVVYAIIGIVVILSLLEAV